MDSAYGVQLTLFIISLFVFVGSCFMLNAAQRATAKKDAEEYYAVELNVEDPLRTFLKVVSIFQWLFLVVLTLLILWTMGDKSVTAGNTGFRFFLVSVLVLAITGIVGLSFMTTLIYRKKRILLVQSSRDVMFTSGWLQLLVSGATAIFTGIAIFKRQG